MGTCLDKEGGGPHGCDCSGPVPVQLRFECGLTGEDDRTLYRADMTAQITDLLAHM